MVKEAVLHFFGISDLGLVRKQNEDAWAIDEENHLFVVADGMGGHRGGEVASQLAVSELVSIFSKKEADTDPLAYLQSCFERVNKTIYKEGRDKASLSGMGTTIVTLHIAEQQGESRAFFGHVGDSRLYLFRDTLYALTKDHSVFAERMTQKATTLEEKKLKHMLTQALGTQLTIKPALNSCAILSHDLFLLVTDGLTNALSEQEIEATLVECIKKKSSLRAMGEHLIERAKEAGGSDNITLILVAVI